jgi:ABC-type branched-subunit amino acid transport system substrate-binding protein
MRQHEGGQGGEARIARVGRLGCDGQQWHSGVTATEIKIGQSMPYSGPASAFGVIGKGEAAYFKMINDKGGINGRKLTLGKNPGRTGTRLVFGAAREAFVLGSPHWALH